MTSFQFSLFLVLPVAAFRKDGLLFVESQALNGLFNWSENFESVVAAVVLYPEHIATKLSGIKWQLVDEKNFKKSLIIVGFPCSYTISLHFSNYKDVQSKVDYYIKNSKYLCFAIGGLFGDWGSLAAIRASSQLREFSIWTDRVESRVINQASLRSVSMLRRFKGIVYSYLVKKYERWVISKAKLGLFHGSDTYNEYKLLVRYPANVNNINLAPNDRIGCVDFAEKKQSSFGRSIRIGYAGRVAEMKAPLDWINALFLLKNEGVDFEAVWLGDGPLLNEARDLVLELNLGDCVSFPGFVSDRGVLIDHLRSWDILMFTHVTPESPRILLEAMVSGTAIVGYKSHYSFDLVKGFGDEYLVPLGDVAGLAGAVKLLESDRDKLSRLLDDTYNSGYSFNDVSVFKERSDLIKNYL